MFQKKYVLLGTVLFVSLFIYLASEILLPFIVGAILAYVLNPIVKKLDIIGLAHPLSVILVLAISILIFFCSFIFLIPIFLDQLQLFFNKIPNVLDSISKYASNLEIVNKDEYNSHIFDILTAKSGQLFEYIFNFLSLSLNKTFAILNFLGLIFITPIVTFYILYDWSTIYKNLKSQLSILNTPEIEKKITKVNNLLASFFRGQLLVAIFLTAFYALTLSIIKIDGAISIGILIGILSFLPYLGTIVGLIISLSFSILQFGSLQAVILVIFIFIIGQLIESYYLSPKFVSKSVGLHPLFSMFIIIASGAAFGFIGVLLAIPVSAVLYTLLADLSSIDS